jgi:hypothetical protein|tara:strand:+ start:338 stop:769 length:432 start_codon:yes stop_codon:yes gene_type:complete
MVYLTYSGYNYSKKRCASIVNWFLDTYLPRHKIIVNVDHKGLLREGIFGWVWAADCDHRPRDFEIEIHNRLDPKLYTETLLHELWHLYQHVKGDLKDKHQKRLWKGIDHSETDYEDQPWEKEAHGMEEKLYREYNSFITNSKS